MKAYSEPDANSATFWDDTKTTSVSIWPRFLGLPDDQSTMFRGMLAPVYSELSGIIMFTDVGDHQLRLYCEGWCSLYVFGVLLVDIIAAFSCIERRRVHGRDYLQGSLLWRALQCLDF